ncbi:MAG: fumarylacetoacetase [Gemmatimonadaceae bacterium]
MRDSTHDTGLRSWVESANDGATDFPIQNLPYGVFAASPDEPRLGVAIGDHVLDLAAVIAHGLLPEVPALVSPIARSGSLNALMALGGTVRKALRRALSTLLRHDTAEGLATRRHTSAVLFPRADVELLLPVTVGDYTDFYSSIHHATNVGTMMRPDNPLLPNYKWIPIGYHGRASSLVVSGVPIRRPFGQTMAEGARAPTFAPSARLDYEAELGFYIGEGNALGARVPIETAFDRFFGVSLLNDWSARDVQAWEYQPLGPFLSKSFATTVSPWVVTTEALVPFRTAVFARGEGDPAPLPYLTSDADQRHGAIDLTVEVLIQSARMRQEGVAPVRLSRGNARDLLWTPAQLLTHHASGGCNLRVGDLLASGTISGPTRDSRGSLLELTWRGSEPIELPTGEVRRFLEDGDDVIMRGRCAADGAASIGFGECRGQLLPAVGVPTG